MNTRKAALSGSWYPSDPVQLASEIDSYITGYSEKPSAIIVPHAGYKYSGKTAGFGYGCLRGHSWDRIVILAPNHRHYLNAVSVPTDYSAYSTPLGDIALDVDAMSELNVKPVMEAHTKEHSIEIQLPFLQRVFKEVPPIVPMLIPQIDQTQRNHLIKIMNSWDNTLFIVSTDFTHYGNNFGYTPFTNNLDAKIKELDYGAINTILNTDSDALLNYGKETGITMCGLQATALALQLNLGKAELLDYSRSGDQDGDYSFSVSYASIVLGGK